MKRKILLITIIAFLIGISFILCYMVAYKKEVQSCPSSLLETSKLIQSQYATARGEVTEISGRTLTLTEEGDTLSIPLREDAGIVTFISLENKEGEEVVIKPELQEIE